MKKLLILCKILFSIQFIVAQNEIVPQKKTQKAFGKIDFLSIELPDNKPNMGYTGLHYNLMLNDWSYTGVGLYGAVTGNTGGFFTLGLNAGIKKYLGKDFFIDTGFHFGGGGGKGAPDGGGAFILPHFNLGFNFKNYSINSGWSYVDFFDGGNIKGHQLNVSLEIPLDYTCSNYDASEKEIYFSDLKNSDWKINSKKTSLMFHQNNLKIKGETKNTGGVKYNGETIRLAGFELASYFTKNWLAFLKVDGAFSGIKAGYMDVFIGGGYMYSFNKNNTNVLTKFGIGGGGGGGIETEGGLLIYPDLSIEQKIFNDVYFALNTGLVMSPNSNIFTQSYGFGIKYYIDRNGIIADKSFSKGKFKGFEVIAKQDLYIDANRDSSSSKDMYQISLQINLDLNKNVYVTGQTSFANFGDAGAYAEGIVGLGARTNSFCNNKINIFGQILGGAAGGGGISTGEGLIVKPSAGFTYKLNNTLSFRTAAGYVKAKGGSLSSTLFNFGVKYHLSFLKMN